MARSVLISGENLQTIVAVTFVLALLAVAFNFFNFTRIQQAYTIAAHVNNENLAGLGGSITDHAAQLQETQVKIDALGEKISALDARITALEQPQP